MFEKVAYLCRSNPLPGLDVAGVDVAGLALQVYPNFVHRRGGGRSSVVELNPRATSAVNDMHIPNHDPSGHQRRSGGTGTVQW